VPEVWRENLGGAPYHHQPRTLEQRWVQIADWLSAAERNSGESEEQAENKPVLQTIFSRITLAGDGKRAEQPAYWQLTRLDVSNRATLFPSATIAENWRAAYRDLWDEFTAQCKQRGITANTTLEPVAYLENLLALMQEFTWCVPSAYWRSVPDVSLFDHARTTAAIAACLALDERDEAWCEAAANRAEIETALLVVGDLSGIQNFIYTLASSGAAKSLRARSFYVQLVSEIIALNVLDALALPLTNLIYTGGGKFYLLAPIQAQDRLPGLAQTLTAKLMRAHQGALGLALEWEVVRTNDFATFSAVFERVGQKLNRKKQQPFAQASNELLAEHLGTAITAGGESEKFCAVTGADWDLETRGEQLPDATHLLLRRVSDAPSERPRDWQTGLRQFGWDVQIVRDNRLAAPSNGGIVRVWRIDPKQRGDASLIATLKPAQVVLAERPIAKLVPRAGETVLTFDELAANARGIKRWGVLRMDVDNLGKLFRDGLGTQASLSRVASLSFGLRLFFEGWLPNAAEGKLANKLYIQYAGGDDVFVVGAWDALPQFAWAVRQRFREFTGENPAFTISGGISIVEESFPLYQAAQMAGAAEDRAKHWRAEKDAINFLDQTSDWQTFAKTMKDAEQLADWRAAHQIPASLLQTIQTLRAQIKHAETQARRNKQPKPQYGRWMWMAAYQLTRAAKDTQNEQIKNGIGEIQTTFLASNSNASAEWGRAARWAQYLARGGK
jgi:CRISPR-associated protein Csm1